MSTLIWKSLSFTLTEFRVLVGLLSRARQGTFSTGSVHFSVCTQPQQRKRLQNVASDGPHRAVPSPPIGQDPDKYCVQIGLKVHHLICKLFCRRSHHLQKHLPQQNMHNSPPVILMNHRILFFLVNREQNQLLSKRFLVKQSIEILSKSINWAILRTAKGKRDKRLKLTDRAAALCHDMRICTPWLTSAPDHFPPSVAKNVSITESPNPTAEQHLNKYKHSHVRTYSALSTP